MVFDPENFQKEDLEAFFATTDFDFSTVAGWEEFFAERRIGCAGREADGIQLRDINNYAVGTANIITSGDPVDVRFTIRQPGSGLALAPATLYINYPDALGARQVRIVSIGGSTSSSQNEIFEAGGGGTQLSPHWNVIYYIIIKVDKLPGLDKIQEHGEEILDEALGRVDKRDSPRA